jgi:hypothetical protein
MEALASKMDALEKQLQKQGDALVASHRIIEKITSESDSKKKPKQNKCCVVM